MNETCSDWNPPPGTSNFKPKCTWSYQDNSPIKEWNYLSCDIYMPYSFFSTPRTCPQRGWGKLISICQLGENIFEPGSGNKLLTQNGAPSILDNSLNDQIILRLFSVILSSNRYIPVHIMISLRMRGWSRLSFVC